MPMTTHVRILAWFNIVLGTLGVIAALMTLDGAAVLPAILTQIADEAAAIPVGIIQFAATVVITIILAMSLPCLVLGFGLYNFRPWGRVLGIVLAAVNLLNVPFGTLVSLYGFWVLLKPETEVLFKPVSPA
ncbi:MAG: hypothetical protein HZB13_12095 [Acidobacteria bacterium]|nr:hypothetical protein [Acidobacteriota bacterium]